MLKNAVVIREVSSRDGEAHYEVYDTDTGSSLGFYDSLERAEAEVQHMDSSDHAAKLGGVDQDADAGSE